MLLFLCGLVFFAVFLVMVVSSWTHHRSRAAEQGNFHESVFIEMIWGLVPWAIVLLLVVPATRMVLAH